MGDRRAGAAFAGQEIAAVGRGQEVLDTAFDDPQTVIGQFQVGGKRVEVVLPGGLGASAAAAGPKKPKRKGGKAAGAAASGDSLTAPMQGTVVKVTVEEGQTVSAGDQIVVVEAMKMEQPINAHKAGVVTGLSVEVGGAVTSGQVVAEIKDAAAE